MSTAVATPAKKKPTPAGFTIDPDKIYDFELSRTFDQAKPTERGTNNKVGEPYPRVVTYPNFGIAIDSVTGDARNWRYIEGQSSIWEDEQTTFDSYEKRDMEAILGREDNVLAVYDGHMLVPGIHKLKLQAMFLQNYFEGNKNPYNKNVSPEYRFKLLNPEEQIFSSLVDIRKRFEVMNAAMEADDETIFAMCVVLGINTDDRSKGGMNNIKLQFLKKAEFDPKNPKGLEFFSETLSNPVTRIRYVFTEGFKKGIISVNQQPGKLTWEASNTAITDLLTKNTPVEELANRVVVDKDTVVIECMKRINDDLTNAGLV